MIPFFLLIMVVFLFSYLDPALVPIIVIFGGIVWWLYESRKDLTEEEKDKRKEGIDAGVEVTSSWFGDSGGGDSGGGPCGGGPCGGG